ncbi:MAG: Ig-like domain-containing protein [Taibaiella sp.]|nr:Ig-like domain-containing protein [Taibaiella sp.]
MKNIFSLLLLLIGAYEANCQIITTIAGTGSGTYSGDGGPASAAALYYPRNVGTDRNGNVYISDTRNFRVRRINSTGTIATIAGNGTIGFSGDGGPATAAKTYYIHGVAADRSGNVFLTDRDVNRIRRVNTADTITTFAGSGGGSGGYWGDGGAAAGAGLQNPDGVAVDTAGNVYIADEYNNRIRKVTPSGIITTIAGNATVGYSGDGGPATAARLGGPRAVAVDDYGNVYIADAGFSRIRKVDTSGIITTIAGTGSAGFSGDGGPATAAQVGYILGLAISRSGDLYLADNSSSRIRKISPSGIITTFAGTGGLGFSGDGGPATAAQLNYPSGVAVDTNENVYIADQYNHRIRKVSCTTPTVTITGSATLCTGTPVTFTSSAAGTTWSSSDTTIALVNTAGVVTGVSAGSATITFVATNSCGSGYATRSVTVDTVAPSAGTIAGATTVCVGTTTLLTNSVTGGSWSSSNTTVASINSAGTVYGITAGSAIITYTVTNGCGSSVATTTVNVNPAPLSAGIITGAAMVYIGTSTPLNNTVSTGTWSSSAPAIASVNTTSGLVYGVNAGMATISYTVSNSCGSVMATHSINVTDTHSIVGQITGTSKGISLFPNPATNAVTIDMHHLKNVKDLQLINLSGKSIYSAIVTGNLVTIPLNNVAAGNYTVKVTTPEHIYIETVAVK